jgi:hypothetical protein
MSTGMTGMALARQLAACLALVAVLAWVVWLALHNAGQATP